MSNSGNPAIPSGSLPQKLPSTLGRRIRNYALAASGLFLVIQFARPEKNITPPGAAGGPDPLGALGVPEDIQTVLKNSCFDCHSRTTRYPWYAEVQPVGWYINTHVRGGLRRLDFNAMPEYSSERLSRRWDSVSEAIAFGSMPLPAYLRLHGDARLTAEEVTRLATWASEEAARLRQKARTEREADGAALAPPPPH
ncbi:hypothetical protein OPIT5_26560 [Opitutaceae bacterium TAV5]|nr:hypothetical protein OPIT5_26560 [Opitutaceae bacterium TAV5]